jgi:hypothetical protein
MLHPAHVDGRSLVMIQPTTFGHRVIATGVLSYDGQTLILRNDADDRVVRDDELAAFAHVTDGTRIPECVGFDFFVFVDA